MNQQIRSLDMTTPPIDIIVPVWNSPFETRACLSAILGHSPEARLIIVDNGSSRETELMLEEFSEPLGERGLFIKSERNIGLVPAINRGLARSDGAFAVILRPHVLVTNGWLEALTDVAGDSRVGIVSPVFSGSGASPLCAVNNRRDCSSLDTFTVSFSALLLKNEMRMQTGFFDEGMDNGEWCLTDYVRRAWSKGYRTCATSRSLLVCGQEAVFGSEERRQGQTRASREHYLGQWAPAAIMASTSARIRMSAPSSTPWKPSLRVPVRGIASPCCCITARTGSFAVAAGVACTPA
jgi:hypothetical protein